MVPMTLQCVEIMVLAYVLLSPDQKITAVYIAKSFDSLYERVSIL